MVRTLPAVVLIVLVSACAAPRATRVVTPARTDPVPGVPREPPAATGAPDAAAAAAPAAEDLRSAELASHVKRIVGVKSLRKLSRRLPDDCSGLIRWAYLQEEIDLARHADWRGDNAVAAFFRLAEEAGALDPSTPQPGDLVFFRETYDRNRDGKRNDGLTHVGVIDEVSDDGRITFVHRANSGVKRSVMTLARAEDHRDEAGTVLNDYLRAAGRGHRGKLTGELFVAFASSGRLFAHVEPREQAHRMAEANRPPPRTAAKKQARRKAPTHRVEDAAPAVVTEADPRRSPGSTAVDEAPPASGRSPSLEQEQRTTAEDVEPARPAPEQPRSLDQEQQPTAGGVEPGASASPALQDAFRRAQGQ